MKLKSLMENKQLDFNQPFLSVRRVSSMETSSKANKPVRTGNRWPPLPVYNSDLKSGPVRNPGNVPFLWEHAPGRPKDGRNSQTIASKSPSVAPKHPSGMSSDSKQQHCSQGSTSGATTQSPTGGGGGDAFPNSDCFPSHKRTVKFRTLRERIERDLSSDSEDDGDETYLEANDTLSRSESFSMNCSVTGLNGLDSGDVKPSGSFSKDQQTHDFMMGRFLPAAKALASDAPQVAHHRKQSVQREQQREARKIVEMDKKHRVNSLPTTLPSYCAPPNVHDEETAQVISEDEDINLDEYEYSSTTACGLFTRFCLRGSSGLLHPVPGMRTEGSAAASAHRVQNDNLTDSSCSSIENLRNEEKSLVGNQTVELQEENSSLGGQSNRKGASNDPKKQYKFPSDPERVGSSKVHSEPHRRGRTKFCELLANESSASPVVIEKTLHVDFVNNMKYQSSNSSSGDTKEMPEFLVDDHDKATRSSETKEILHLDSSPQHVQPSNVEGETKRLSSTSMESMDSCSSYYDANSNPKATILEVDLIQDDTELPKAKVTNAGTNDSRSDQSERSSNQESLRILHHKKSSQEESSDDSFQDFVSFTSSEASNREKLHLESRVPKGQDFEENSNGHNQVSITSTSSRATARGKINLESTRRPKSSLPISSQLALAPPLPKSPSESWLKRTLPTISSRNSTTKSTLAARIYATRKNTVF